MNWIKTMTEREIADWEREIKHAEKMQEQRKSKVAKVDGEWVDLVPDCIYSNRILKTKDWRNENKIN